MYRHSGHELVAPNVLSFIRPLIYMSTYIIEHACFLPTYFSVHRYGIPMHLVVRTYTHTCCTYTHCFHCLSYPYVGCWPNVALQLNCVWTTRDVPCRLSQLGATVPNGLPGDGMTFPQPMALARPLHNESTDAASKRTRTRDGELISPAVLGLIGAFRGTGRWPCAMKHGSWILGCVLEILTCMGVRCSLPSLPARVPVQLFLSVSVMAGVEMARMDGSM